MFSRAVSVLYPFAIALPFVLVGCGGSHSSNDNATVVDDQGQLSRSGKWMVDKEGRVVIGHGIHVAQKSSPYYPDFLTEADVKFLANQGFTAARIDFVWAAAEPNPGVYDDTYIRKVLQVNSLFAKYKIRTLVDFHQNGWNARAGAAQWATFDGPAGTSFGYPFQAFWDDRPASDGIGIQTHFVRLWAHVAQLISSDPDADNIVGYDPFNEPSPGVNTGCPTSGAACPSFEAGALTDFYRRIITAIRATGDKHVIWPEGPPSGQTPVSFGSFEDSQLGFNFHYYATAAIVAGFSDRLMTSTEETAATQQEAQALPLYFGKANQLGWPSFMSEFGCSDDAEDINRVVDYSGRAFSWWTHWQYDMDGEATGPCPGLVIDKNQPASMTNVKLPRLTALAVPYAHVIAGTPMSSSFDPSTRVFSLTYSPRAIDGSSIKANTSIFVPQLIYPKGYKVAVTGARIVSRPTAAWVDLLNTSDDVTVSVTISPDSSSTTDLPWQ